MALFQGELNEFIDWISKRDVLTNRSTIPSSDEISGLSIRNLLQTHLRKPFYVHVDTDNNKKLLFSSEESKIRYYNALNAAGNNESSLAQKFKDLVLLEFDVPAPHKIYCVGKDNSQLKTINILSGGERVMVEFLIYIDDVTSGLTSNFEIKYNLLDNNNNSLFETTRIYEPEYSTGQKIIQFDCNDYLAIGSNKLQMTIKLIGEYSADPINPMIPINLIRYNISGDYMNGINWYDPVHVNSDLNINIKIDRSINEDVQQVLEYYIDNMDRALGSIEFPMSGLVNQKTLRISAEHTKTLEYPTADNPSPKHYLLIKGSMSKTDNSINFKSNSLVYEFVAISDDQEQIFNHYINAYYSVPANKINTDDGIEGIALYGIQYEEFQLNWTYYSNGQMDTNVDVVWMIEKINVDDETQNERILLSTLEGQSGSESEPLRFIPDSPYSAEDNVYLIANVISKGGERVYERVFRKQIIISKSAYELEFNEAQGYYFKLNAYGRSNTESEASRKIWTPTGGISTLSNVPIVTFTDDMTWDTNNGWYNNGLTLNSEDCYGTINFNAFPNTANTNIATRGRTIEIDFMTGGYTNENDPLIIIGSDNEQNRNGAAIYIYPTKAILYVGASEVIKTNYKSNERIQLTFIFNPENASDPNNKNIYIVNNGILERGANLNDQSIGNSNGQIKFGGTNSQITIYNMRLWWNNISIYDAFLNFLFDVSSKSKYIIRNSIRKGEEIDYDACALHIDTFLITGDLSNVLDSGAVKEKSETAVNIKYTTPTDTKYLGFNATNIKIRKHGQSTLNYPISSFKIWLNKSKGETTPAVEFNDGVKNLKLVKNRYPINIKSIPSNKYVLQANYADSSGVHNGGLLKLINDTWYNAPFKNTNGDIEYRLRTAPQLFASNQLVHHNNVVLNEVGNSAWVEGYGNTEYVIDGVDAMHHTWGDLKAKLLNNTLETSFPYKIRNAPDSRPAVVFYTDTSKSNLTKKFLGQFVLMDDKKSDHIFGERSIYLWGDGTDPFCMTVEGATTPVRNSKGNIKNGYDIDDNCVWNNKNVLRIECVLINTPLTSFMDFYVSDKIETDENGDPIISDEGHHAADEIKYQTNPDTGEYELDNAGNKIPLNFYWEDYFEMIFPDEDDIADDDAEKGLTKFSEGSKFRKKMQPWINFLQWMCSIGQLNVDNNGNARIDGTTSTAAQTKFEQEAHDHLDLYKVAAYYIFYIRFGLVDSVERNAQFKTYDGEHWFFEAWDMDIGLGNKNTGGLAFDPPMDRNTMLSATTYAYSGRSSTTSNVLWDCLENWKYWRETIVPEVAQALYDGGLTYENITKVFDSEFADKWSELIYNESGLYKYVEKAQSASWLGWLQGARTSHRHWWVSTSMNYYDSKWTCGQFNASRIYIAADKAQGKPAIVTIIPTSQSFFKLTQKDSTSNLGLYSATKDSPARWDITGNSFSAKDPAHIYGALFIESLDLGGLSQGLQVMTFQNAVDPVQGATIKELSIGVALPNSDITSYEGWVNTVKPNITNTSSLVNEGDDNAIDALSNIETINVTGQLKLDAGDIISNTRNKLKNIYAAGTGMVSLTSSNIGNKFNILRLPGETIEITGGSETSKPGITSFNLNNTSWNDITFWSTRYNLTTQEVPFVDEEGRPQYDEEGNQIMITIPPTASFTKMNKIPRAFSSVTFKGSTASNRCSAQFILDWFDSIEYYVKLDNPGLTGDALEEKVLEYISTNCKANIEKIRWNYGVSEDDPNFIEISYKDIIRFGHLNGAIDSEGHGANYPIGGSSLFNGYIKFKGDPMEPWQLAELVNLFGENVFSINAISSSLVIDQQQSYAQISVSGNITIENNNIIADEGSVIKLKCTSFLLSAESVTDYNWIVNGQNLRNYSIEPAQDGFTMNLIIEQTPNESQYDITVSAIKKTDSTVNANTTIYINPAVTPKDWSWSILTNNSTIRNYIAPESTMLNLFGANRTTYLIPTYNLTNEIKIDTNTDFTAKIKNIKFKFEEVSIAGNLSSSSLQILDTIRSGFNAKDISVNDSNTEIDIDKSSVLFINKNAKSYVRGTLKIINGEETGINNSIVIKSTYNQETFNNVCNDMKLIVLTAEIQYESSSIGTQIYKCNLILYNDSVAIMNQSQPSFQTIKSKLRTYSEDHYKSVISLFKSDLSIIDGTLAFKDDNDNPINMESANALLAQNIDNVSIFDFMPNVEIIDLSGSNYPFNVSNINYFNMNKLKSLRQISLNNCSNANMVFRFENSYSLDTIDFGGICQGNLICKNVNNLTTIHLGKPQRVDINNCRNISLDNFTISDNSAIISIDLKLDSGTPILYKMLDKLMK